MEDENKKMLQRQRNAWRKKRLMEKKRFVKTSRLELRCTENEKAYIKLQAQDESISNYVLECALFGEYVQIDFSDLKEYTAAINHLGNNINQIARNMNALAKIGGISEAVLIDIMNQLDEYQKLIGELMQTNQKIYRKMKKHMTSRAVYSYDDEINYQAKL